MTTTKDLATCFNSLALGQDPRASVAASSPKTQQTKRHLIMFDFPALWLLDDINKAHLHEPHLMNWRGQPEPRKFNLNHMAPNVSYLLGQDTTSSPDNDRPPSSSNVAGILKGINDSRKVHGQSTISAVAHTTAGELQVRLGPTTAPANSRRNTQICDLTNGEWDQLIATDCPWVKLHADVVHRKSAQTYLVADQILSQRNPDLHHQDLTRLNGRWSSWLFGTPHSPVELFRARLRRPHSQDIVHRGDFIAGACRIALPCDHGTSLSEKEFESLTDQQCVHARCKECTSQILQPEDQDEIDAFRKDTEFEQYSECSRGWTELDNEEADTARRIYKSFSCKVLTDSAALALHSLDTPTWVQPTETCLVHSEAAAAAMQCLQKLFPDPCHIIQERPKELYDNLVPCVLFQAQEALGYDLGELVPGWAQFLKIWLLRTMNFVSTRRCTRSGSDHRGVHQHGRDLYWQDVDEAANHLGDDLDDALILLDRAGDSGYQFDPRDTDDQWWTNG